MTVMTKPNKRDVKKSTPVMSATVEAVTVAAGDVEPVILKARKKRGKHFSIIVVLHSARDSSQGEPRS